MALIHHQVKMYRNHLKIYPGIYVAAKNIPSTKIPSSFLFVHVAEPCTESFTVFSNLYCCKVIVMASERYSFSLTTFSPSGKLVQIEYALAAVAAGAASVGIKASNGVVLATENKHKSILYDEHSVKKVEMITKHIGMVYSGMGPDYRLLVKQARKIAQQYQLIYQEPIPTAQLVQRVAMLMQEYTQSGGVRPFGVSLLICGWDNGKPCLYQCDPSGAYFAWKATAMGKNFVNGKVFLEKRYSEDLELDDAVHTAILTLKEGFEGQMTADNIEVGICDANGFRRLEPSNVKDYLANIP